MIKTLTVVAIFLASLSTSSASSAESLGDFNYTLDDSYPIDNIDCQTFAYIVGVVVDKEGNVIIFHQGTNRPDSKDANNRWPAIPENTVISFKPDEDEIVHSWGKNRFHLPQSISLDSTGDNIWLADSELHQVFKYSRDGSKEFVSIGDRFKCTSYICHPTSVADNGEFVFVITNHQRSRIYIFTAEGSRVGSLGESSDVSAYRFAYDNAPSFSKSYKVIFVEATNLTCVTSLQLEDVQCFRIESKNDQEYNYHYDSRRLVSITAESTLQLEDPQSVRNLSDIGYSPFGGGVIVTLRQTNLANTSGSLYNATTGKLIAPISFRTSVLPNDLVVAGELADSIYVVTNYLSKFSRPIQERKELNGTISEGNKTVTNVRSTAIPKLTCGGVIDKNETIFVNPQHPRGEAGSDTCHVTVERQPNVCQIRLDFDKFVLDQSDENGLCATDFLMIPTSVGERLPILCGDNSGQHMYVNLPRRNLKPLKLLVVTNTARTIRKWRIRVSMIPCRSIEMAPSGCLQFYQSPSAVVRSFNYGPAIEGRARYPPKLRYTSCIQAEEDSCAIEWKTVQPDSFSFGSPSEGNITELGGSAGGRCNSDDFVSIDQASESGIGPGEEQFCGSKLFESNTIVSRSKPFQLKVRSDANHTRNSLNSQVGFALRYSQLPCEI